MTSFIIPPPATPSVAVANSTERFPVRRIFCVGRNYAAHARELGNDERDPPFFFTKPGDAVVDSDSTIPYPALTKNLHHEIELVVAIGKAGFRIPRERAPDHVWGYGVGIDLTRRDLEIDMVEGRQPAEALYDPLHLENHWLAFLFRCLLRSSRERNGLHAACVPSSASAASRSSCEAIRPCAPSTVVVRLPEAAARRAAYSSVAPFIQ